MGERGELIRRVAVTTITVGDFAETPTLSSLATQGWRPGPLELELRMPGRRAVRASTVERATYLDRHTVASILGDGGPTWRASRWLTPVISNSRGLVIWAVELLRFPPFAHLEAAQASALRCSASSLFPEPAFAVVLHASIDSTDLAIADIHANVREVRPSSVSTVPFIGSMRTVEYGGVSDVFQLTMVTTSDGAVWPLSGDVGDPDTLRHWLFSFASATLPRELAQGKVPDFEADDEVLAAELPSGTVVAPSADWRVGVLRSGAAFVGRRPDSGFTSRTSPWLLGAPAQSNGSFFDAGELYMRTLYTDTVLLGTLQRYALRELRKVVLDAAASADDVDRSRLLDNELQRFREQFWWTDATRGAIGDRLLGAYQLQHSLPQLLEQVVKDTQSIAQRVHIAAERRKAGALAALAVLGLFSVLLSVAAFVRPPSMNGLTRLICLVVVLLLFGGVVVLLHQVLPDLSRVVREALMLPRRKRLGGTRSRRAE